VLHANSNTVVDRYVLTQTRGRLEKFGNQRAVFELVSSCSLASLLYDQYVEMTAMKSTFVEYCHRPHYEVSKQDIIRW
jgi:hypothetical protein